MKIPFRIMCITTIAGMLSIASCTSPQNNSGNADSLNRNDQLDPDNRSNRGDPENSTTMDSLQDSAHHSM